MIFAGNSKHVEGFTISCGFLSLAIDKEECSCFFGLLGYYHHFIPKFAKIAVPLTNLTRKMPNQLLWSSECEEAFKSSKETLLKAQVLVVVDPEPFILQMDASERGLGSVLRQVDAGQ